MKEIKGMKKEQEVLELKKKKQAILKYKQKVLKLMLLLF